jgi:hypothetical protein
MTALWGAWRSASTEHGEQFVTEDLAQMKQLLFADNLDLPQLGVLLSLEVR